MKKLFFLTLFILLFALSTCSDNPVTDETLQPGRRDYVWTVDTLDGLNNPRFRMWGSSPLDIWATSISNWEVSISHFDGSQWTSYGVPGIVQPNAIYGFSSTNILIGAENGQIWRFDGSDWNLFAELTKDGRNDIVFNDLWGESPDNIFAFGAYPDEYGYNNSVIAHFIEKKWISFNTDELYGIVTDLYKNLSDNRIYLLVNGGRNLTDSTQVYEYTREKYTKLYGNIWTKGLQADISLINGEVYFILGNEIVKRKNNQFQTLLQVDNPNFYQRIWGRNSKDIFLLMTNGLAHYNSINIEYLFTFTFGNAKPWTQIYGAALFENEVFFLVDEPPTGLSLIYHGILK